LIEKFVAVKNILDVGPIEGNFQPTSTLWLPQLEFAFSSSVSIVKLAGCLAQFSQLVRLAYISSPVWLAHFSCLVWLAKLQFVGLISPLLQSDEWVVGKTKIMPILLS
jgi:hypothetical protein